jgi:hypothetical protein
VVCAYFERCQTVLLDLAAPLRNKARGHNDQHRL